jgi:hypothetical protein
MSKKTTVPEAAEHLLEKTDKLISAHNLKPKRSEAKEKNKASTQRKAIEHDLDKSK